MKLPQIFSFIIINFIVLESFSQKCEPYFPMKEGVEFELTNFDKNDKITGKAIHKVISKTSNGDNMECEIHMISFNEKDQAISSNDYKVYCKNGKFEFDMKMFMDNEELSNYQNMDITVDADFIEVPSNPVEGESLNDGKMVVNIGSSGVKIMSMKLNIFNRKVQALEKITTPAGTYNCVKISFDTETRLIVKVTGSVIEWYCKDVGMVKSESYNKKGKLIGYSMLTDIK